MFSEPLSLPNTAEMQLLTPYVAVLRSGTRDEWVDKIKELRELIEKMEQEPPKAVVIGCQSTHEYPYLLGDLRLCVTGFNSLM